MKLGFYERPLVTLGEYMQIVEGKSRDREFEMRMTRRMAYYSLIPHMGKKKLQEKDLWKIGEDEVARFNMNTKEHKQRQAAISAYCEANGIIYG